ncbi:hypothetical protein MAR_007661, partial [Mya arenaria]
GNSLKNKETNEYKGENVPNGLPSTSSSLTGTLNTVVKREYQTLPQLSGKRKRGQYSSYSSEIKAKMARYVIESGNSWAKVLMKAQLDHSSRFICYELKTKGVDQVIELPVVKRGRPTILPRALEDSIKSYIRELRNAGG